MAINPYQKYKQQSVMTMTQGEMVVKLYDEVIKQLAAACVAIDEKNLPDANAALLKSQKIVNHLRTTLNTSIEISNNLEMLYEFFVNKMVTANVKKDKSHVEEILPLISELRESFAQADRTVRMQQNIGGGISPHAVQRAVGSI